MRWIALLVVLDACSTRAPALAAIPDAPGCAAAGARYQGIEPDVDPPGLFPISDRSDLLLFGPPDADGCAPLHGNIHIIDLAPNQPVAVTLASTSGQTGCYCSFTIGPADDGGTPLYGGGQDGFCVAKTMNADATGVLHINATNNSSGRNCGVALDARN